MIYVNKSINNIKRQQQNGDTQNDYSNSNQPEISLMCAILNPTIKGIEYV